MKKDFTIIRVVTRDVLRDSFQSIRNFFGLRLRSYENLLKQNIDKMVIEMRETKKVIWYKLIVNPLTIGSAMLIIYGEENE